MNNKKGETYKKGKVDDILSKEEEYRRLNEQLEARTAVLDQETEAVLKEHEAMFCKRPSLLDNVDMTSDGQLLDWEPEDDAAEARRALRKPVAANAASRKAQESARGSVLQRKTKTPTPRMTKPNKESHNVVSVSSSVGDKVGNRGTGEDDDDASNYIQKAISNIEMSLDKNKDQPLVQEHDDVLPAYCSEVGADMQLRLVKAKAQVLQEEVGRLARELGAKDDCLREVQAKLKDSEEEKGRLQRNNVAQQTQMQKYKKLMESAKEKADSLEIELANCKKELDSMKKNQKQHTTAQGTLEVRLNRALEDCEKYKTQLEKMKSGTKENIETDRRRLEELTMENKKLEKQKAELINGYKKQLKLIDILKRKQMHLEAAKLLSFTEEEFIKAMEWQT